MEREQKLEWNLTNQPFSTMGHRFADVGTKLVEKQMPDLADMFPFETWRSEGHIGDGWIVIRMSGKRAGNFVIQNLQGADLQYLISKISPFQSRSHGDLVNLLGPTWFGFNRFTYVGPYSSPFASWPDAEKHLTDWLNNLVIPEILKRNEERVLRAIPPAPQFNLDQIQRALWVLECEESTRQGTAFHLSGVGLVTCEHVLGPSTHAYKPNDSSHKYPVSVRALDKAIDLAILKVDVQLGDSLPMGSADSLKQLDHLAITGFPNYRLGDTGVIVPGLVIGFRMVSGIRRILTNAPIIAGNSGGPVLDKRNKVVGVAVTGAESMEQAHETDNHGIIPIDALKFFTT